MGILAAKTSMQMDARDVARASVTLARAFQDDPLMAFLFPNTLKRARTLPWFLGTTVRYCLAYGVVQATPDLGAVACWLPPGHTKVTPTRVLQTGGAATPFRFGKRAFTRLLAWQRYVTGEHARHVPGRHLYLYTLGVDPLSRGRGLGRALLEPVLRQADAKELPCYLETQTQANLRVYRSVGFELVGVGKTPGYDLVTYALRRAPQPLS